MINWMTHHTKRRFMLELKSILENHPRYAEDAKNVVNKFSYTERSARGIIINSTSAERVRLSADNYIGRQHSFVVMSPYRNSKATSVEFVNENMPALEQIDKYRNTFPSPPGVYLLKFTSLPSDGTREPGFFTLKKFIKIEEPDIIIFNSSMDQVAQLSHLNIYPNSVNLYLNDKIRLIPGTDYTVDYENSEVRFLKETPTGYSVSARYSYGFGLDSVFEYHRNTYQVDVIPGTVIAFGDRMVVDDEVAIRVYDKRSPVADVYGGKFQINLDLLTYSKDASDREQLVDYVTTSILERQLALIDGGMELMEVSPGTDGEESFNPETDEYYFEQSINVQLRVDWMVMAPLMLDNTDIEMTSYLEDKTKGHLDGTYTYDLLNAIELDQVSAVSRYLGNDIGLVRIV